MSLSKCPALHLLLNSPLATSGMAYATSEKTDPDHNRILSFKSSAVGSSFKADVGMVLEAQFKPTSREQGTNDAEPPFPKATRCQPSRVLETVANMGTCLGTSLHCGWHFASGAQLSWKAAGATASRWSPRGQPRCPVVPPALSCRAEAGSPSPRRVSHS